MRLLTGELISEADQPDNRWVIYNASPFGTNQVHAAQVPPEFLASLD